jgi:beta-lactamase regulating signal transducer with metallopeptidase domain
MAFPTALLLTPADSAHVVGELYGLSLPATLVVVVTAVLLLTMRRASAGARALACRAAVVAMLAVVVGRLLPVRSMLWVVPETLAGPLIALGKAQLGAGPSPGAVVDGGVARAEGRGALAPPRAEPERGTAWLAPALLIGYGVGALLVLAATARARWRLRRHCRAATRCDSPAWRAAIRDAATVAGLSDEAAERVQLFTSHALPVPLTWGSRWWPVIVLPHDALAWRAAHRHAALVHELSHVRHGDACMAIVARVACALFWFHPGAWWLAARLSAESELACDDRVLLGGVRRSDYAELLVEAQGTAASAAVRLPTAGMALVGRGGVRRRLAAIVDTERVLRAPSRAAFVTAMLGSALLAAPLGTVRIAPTRAVLDTLMRDVSWESRAYAVVRLAQRPDSVDMARTAARLDPSPEVRAWARFAVGEAEARHRVRAPSIDPSSQRRARIVRPTFLH